MLTEIKKLKIENQGHERKVSVHRMYINTDNIISITDYDAIKSFLINEGVQEFFKENFSLIKLSSGTKTDDIIAFGTADEVYSSIREPRKVLLNE